MSIETFSGSAFHPGEVALQREAGVAERMARVGSQVIRPELPEQHRRFFPLLPFVVVGSIDRAGQPTASLLAAPPGFATSPDPEHLRIDALPSDADPLDQNLRLGAPLGVLGIQPHTRRRNRVNGTLVARDAGGFSLAVQQSFGNCPKYIWPREHRYVGPSARPELQISTLPGPRERELIAGADTFYLASAHPQAGSSSQRSHGVDVSHRGGPLGFLHFTDATTFSLPDFPGNNFYNTLGNLRLNPRAGLLFLDGLRGDVLQLEAAVEVGSGSHPLTGPQNEVRILQFRVRRARLWLAASPVRWSAEPELEVP